MTKSGYFITIEGGEATGKTTQLKNLQNHFARNKKYYFTREPGGSSFAEEMREYIITGAEDKILPISELLLLNAARYDHLERVIFPKLEQGVNIICDRFFDSTVAYQGVARGVAKNLIDDLHRLITNNFFPDLTIVLDLDPELAQARIADRNKGYDERFEKFSLDFHQKVRNSFLDLQNSTSRNVKIVDASKSPTLVFSDIIAAIEDLD